MKDNLRTCLLIVAVLATAACTALPGKPSRLNGQGPLAALAYQQALPALSAGEIARDRAELAAMSGDPDAQMRLALLLAHPRGTADMARAQALLEAIQRNAEPAAVRLQPLARLLGEQLAERQKLETHNERLALQLKEGQRKLQELQEKLDRLAEIERSLPSRPRSPLPGSLQ